MATTITFTVPGRPQPGGSKRAFPNRKTGGVIVTDANPQAKPWQHAIRVAARTVYQGPLLTGPLRLTARFYFAHPKGHFGSGTRAQMLKASAPAQHTNRPDTLKLTRALEDALTGVVYRDDSQIADEHLSKHWTTAHERVEVELVLLDP